MAQRYSDPKARGLMELGLCPECGTPALSHLDDPRFWVPRRCDLLAHGVTERIERYRADKAESNA